MKTSVGGGTIFTGATSDSDGTSGLVPAPSAGQQTYFLRGDGTWVEISSSSTGGVTIVSGSLSLGAGYLYASKATTTQTINLEYYPLTSAEDFTVTYDYKVEGTSGANGPVTGVTCSSYSVDTENSQLTLTFSISLSETSIYLVSMNINWSYSGIAYSGSVSI